MGQRTSIENQVDFGVTQIDPERRVDVSLQDLMHVYATVGELVKFFHQPNHYPSLEDVRLFIGDKNHGALHLLWDIYYKRLRDIWPEDIQRAIEEGQYDNPIPPCYYEKRAD